MSETKSNPKHILVADDEDAVRDAIGMLLKIDGHTVVSAANGREALECFQRERFDLVLTDFQMPGMKGNELAMAIRELKPSQPIIMVTAHETPPPGASNPVNAIVHKPFTLDHLRRTIQTYS
jgi:CheY-like chemotaxis protein